VHVLAVILSQASAESCNPRGLGVVSMFDNLTKVASFATLAVLVLTALFNVGYFYEIGFHFIGVIDISNVVYAFGLVLVLALVFLFLGGLVAVGYETVMELWVGFPNGLKLAVAFLSLLAFTAGVWELRKLQYDEAQLALAIVAPSIGAGAVLLSLKHWPNANAKVAMLLGLVIGSLGILLGGAAMARQQIARSDVHYDIVTKSGAFVDVRILRSSSSGFVFSAGDHILFVPSGEVRLIKATNDAAPRAQWPAR
jgi:hypothetical protein